MATTPTLQENVETIERDPESALSPDTEEENEGNESKNEGESGRKRRKSVVWAHFKRLLLDKTNGEPCAKCKYCPTIIGCDSTRHGTNGMRKHVKKCPKNPNKANKLAQSLLLGSRLGSSKTLSHHLFNQLDCRQAIAIFVILDEMPFNVMEGDGFKEMMRRLEPRFKVPSRATVTRDCYKLYLEEARKLKRYFKKSQIRVSLTTNTWTSNQNANYMCLIAHWVDEHWTYQNRILNFCVVEIHKGETITQEIEKCLLIGSIDKVFTITVDNAYSNDIALASLKGVLRHWNGLVCDGEFLHLRCCTHILNLIVSNRVKDMHKCIEGSLYVTLNVCFQQIVDVFAILYKSENNHDSLLCDMAKSMLTKYNKYWGNLEKLNLLLVVAVVLDPRYKMKYLQFAFEDMFPETTQREAMTKKVSDVLYRLYNHYSSGVDTSQTQS
ncbi:zinc finger BED domain-containing protein RICESLEEPER 2-like [Prosopis cineraria]|uniref:zinc finger BED domain-containing protein RICESLEEPER 2-like n=1 Tax=Prosopis cineraria TaxID=364024 RepID=UPI002410A0B8|nr:zinc finger BED domain-containing protein RICESLEEPER 2-like [Prosopis cineraria]